MNRLTGAGGACRMAMRLVFPPKARMTRRHGSTDLGRSRASIMLTRPSGRFPVNEPARRDGLSAARHTFLPSAVVRQAQGGSR